MHIKSNSWNHIRHKFSFLCKQNMTNIDTIQKKQGTKKTFVIFAQNLYDINECAFASILQSNNWYFHFLLPKSIQKHMVFVLGTNATRKLNHSTVWAMTISLPLLLNSSETKSYQQMQNWCKLRSNAERLRFGFGYSVP